MVNYRREMNSIGFSERGRLEIAKGLGVHEITMSGS